MGKTWTLLKWTTKLGILGGAVYGAQKAHFFGSQQETQAAYACLQKSIRENEYYQMIPDIEIPEEFQESIKSIKGLREYQSGAKYYWNTGVLFTFSKIAALPDVIAEYSSKGKEMILNLSAGEPESSPGQKQIEKQSEKKEIA